VADISKITSLPKVPSKKGMGKPSASVPKSFSISDHQIVSFENRMTYTFAYEKEVGSIHYDKGRKEIFFKGHNIRNMDVEKWQWQVLEGLRKMLHSDPKWQEYAAPYGQTLDKIVHEKSKVRVE